jgi:hypothetical protein
MHKARAFFFVCLGILCIVAAYQLGATSAKAQVGTKMVGIAWVGWWNRMTAIDESGQLYEELASGWTATFQLPGTPVAMSTKEGNGAILWVLMENGDLYEGDVAAARWPPTFKCNILGSATPAQSISIGQLKAKYATSAPAVKP